MRDACETCAGEKGLETEVKAWHCSQAHLHAPVTRQEGPSTGMVTQPRNQVLGSRGLALKCLKRCCDFRGRAGQGCEHASWVAFRTQPAHLCAPVSPAFRQGCL
eukprot:1160192-Pelagomonas_calceolata.AAC.5